MPSVKFSDQLVKNTKYAEGASDLWDKSLAGFGLRVSPAGKKSWVVMYRVRHSDDKKKHRVTLGHYPAMSLADARSEAKKIISTAWDGIDPGAPVESETSGMTVKDLSEIYSVHMDGKLKKRTIARYKFAAKVHIIPAIGDRAVESITRTDLQGIVQKVSKVTGTSAGVAASYLSCMFKFAKTYVTDSGQMLSFEDPSEHVTRPPPGPSRTRVLSPEEVALLWKASEHEKHFSMVYLRVLILLGQRATETVGNGHDRPTFSARSA